MTREAAAEAGKFSVPPPVLVADEGATRVITINRPEARNAIDLATAELIEAALDEYEARDDLNAAIVTGTGSTFCAGMDLKAFLRGERPSTPRRGFAGLVEEPPAKPLIAAVDGPAVAGGFEIALACDLIVASRSASFGLPEVKRGLVAAGGGLLRLPQRVSLSQALLFGLTGGLVSGEDAYTMGLAVRLVEPGQALPAARELAAQVAANGPLAVAATKRILLEASGWSRKDAFHRQREITEPVRASEDAMEGAQAFLERRPPAWRRR